MLFLKFFSAFVLVKIVSCAMEPFVLGGKEAQIVNYPHSVYLNVFCDASFICGGSILNQVIVLTAAHCMEDCTRKATDDVYVKYGHEIVDNMRSVGMKDFLMHERYNEDSMINDIAVVRVKQPIRLGRGVRRVALLSATPRNVKLGYTAGWGVMNNKEEVSLKLLDVVQELQPPDVCKMVGKILRGTFCAGPIKGIGGPDRGDSGSALIVQNYVQIGIVSYKVQRYSLVVYTNVSYHYAWVRRAAASLACMK